MPDPSHYRHHPRPIAPGLPAPPSLVSRLVEEFEPTPAALLLHAVRSMSAAERMELADLLGEPYRDSLLVLANPFAPRGGAPMPGHRFPVGATWDEQGR